jgi:hypothetical protein
VDVVEVVTEVSEVLLTGGEEVDKIQSPRTSTMQLGGMDDVGDGEELGGVVVGGVDVEVSVVGEEDGEELPGVVVEGVDVEVGDEEEGGSLVDGGGVVDGGSDDEGVELVDGGSVFVGLVLDDVVPGGVEDEEVGPEGNIRRDEMG